MIDKIDEEISGFHCKISRASAETVQSQTHGVPWGLTTLLRHHQRCETLLEEK